MDLGAHVEPGGVRFRLWAPKRRRVEVVLESDGSRVVALEPDGDGYFSGLIEGVRPGDLYRYKLDGGDAFPDPYSRFQPDGPHGPSEVIDPGAYRWRHSPPSDLRLAGQVIYEAHVGTLTPEGTYLAAISQLAELKRLGITMIEIMPLAEFSGRWGWGYDGVDLFAPFHHYGRPDDLRRLVDEAHGLGLAVILDVVYNHLGPDGNYITQFTDTFFSTREDTDWGQRINYDGPGSAGVRQMMIRNACHWLVEYHFDGLRLDATMEIHDDSPVHLLAELSNEARATAVRPILLVGESEPQDVRLVAPTERGGWGLDALWSDDFHHASRVALTGQRGAYYFDYTGSAQEILSCVKRGPLFQGQRYEWQDQPRGWTVRREPAQSFVFYLQNHDQVANQLTGERLHHLCHPGRYRALTALLLLAPETPLLFMGEEFAASAPFLYFSDHHPELQAAVDSGRIDFLYQFPNMKHIEAQQAVPPPGAAETFMRSKIDFSEREEHHPVYRMYRDLLRLRRRDPVIARQDRFALDGAVLAPEAFVIRFFGERDDDRLLIVNLGPDRELIPAAEPLLAPVDRGKWKIMWSSESVRYGGLGVVPPYGRKGWRLQGTSAVLLRARPAERP
ncbi:MAG: malto-oligosyltrehalose trehalohydrolase [Gemmatimonadetes bacterium]|nr:malto-oligosyltrehalose trehalohydrolase [Gemmatimonadota bacterium]